MRGLGGGYGDPQTLRQVVKQPMQIRAAHEGFVTEAAQAVSSSLNESALLLREAGVPLGGTKREKSPRGQSPSPAPTMGSPQAQSRFGFGNTAGSPLTPMHVSMEETLVLPRSGRSARELFAALSESGGVGQTTPRTITVRDFQRGKPVVTPAEPGPFPGPGQMSPGERRRAAAVATSISFGKTGAHGASDTKREKPQLADGVTSMLPGVYTDLGELALAPMAPGSSFDALLDRLVDAPESCFARPLAAGGAIGAKAPRHGDSSPRGGMTGYSSPARSLSPR
eukprot:TRINITY_DN11443_c0_g1_i1.p1 TRINITY_DN11443_c0_g1~~TRINITY_DN11443_c0_g1_i1.p1  ORF type:complete len:282 (+),score=50.90 TRINITY_DN11443_c0_g1_i1:78-923(+)